MKIYEEPKIVVVEFERMEDVITTSSGELNKVTNGGNTGLDWTDWF